MRVLPILWGWEPSTFDWARLKGAKTRVAPDVVIQPVRAVPGSPGRVLAIGRIPHWICEYWLIQPEDPDIDAALAWALGLGDGGFNAVTEEQMLSEALGVEVREIGPGD